ncbi:gliding motility-associated C-terminal domain-containing protein [Neolewinella antarctica]|uniref:Gliding motility-associated-like protein n=1 Tax=Neolewinella antarctica TaxID=442734 RepID=A0ABX0X7J7_9BACT|nr:gliding motility-associated C-terminal domain-containing protein [Neolewinella antarctica]NJC25181.1 gliding motility-associated-like protein [Neolewinella antarctica]
MKLFSSSLLFQCVLLLCSLPLFSAPASAPENPNFQGGMDSVSVTITNPDTVTICRGDSLQLTQTNNVNDAGLTWRPVEGFISQPDDPNPFVRPVVSRFYVVTVSNATGTASDSIYVNVNQLIVPRLVSDTAICQNSALTLVQSEVTNSRGTTYEFTPGRFLVDSTDVNSTFLPRTAQGVTFTLIATSADSICADTQTVRIDVINSQLNISAEDESAQDTVFRCNDDSSIRLTASPSAGLMGAVTWFPTTGIVGATTGPSIRVNPRGDITYYASAEVNGCTQVDSLAIRVDSLPPFLALADNTGLTAEPVKDPYCIGDTFYLLGTIFDVEDYKLVQHEWIVNPGIQSANDSYNGVFTATDTTEYARVTTNGGCVDTALIQINVIKPPILIFDPPNPFVCAGVPLPVTVSFDPSAPSGTLEWDDPLNTLSCTDCLNPVVTTNEPVTYQITVTAEDSDCPSSATYTVNIAPDLFLEVIATLPDGTPVPAEGVREGETVIFSIANLPAGYDGDLAWSGNGSPGTGDGPTITVVAPGGSPSLVYSVFATSETDCDGEGQFSLPIIQAPDVDGFFSIPEIISANKDGTNDNFRVFFETGTSVEDYSLSVYNRFGQEVFESTDPTAGWDGDRNGKPQNLGTYLYVARFSVDGVEVERDGQFVLVR